MDRNKGSKRAVRECEEEQARCDAKLAEAMKLAHRSVNQIDECAQQALDPSASTVGHRRAARAKVYGPRPSRAG